MMERNDFVQLVEAVTSHLAGWTATIDPRENSAAFTHNGLTFYVEGSHYNGGRLFISPYYGDLHRHLPLNAKHLSITVSAKRTGLAIANDIARRFLPEFTDLIEKCRQNATRHANRIAQTQATTADLIAASNGLLTVTQRNAYNATTTLSARLSDASFKIAAWPEYVTLELHYLPPDMAHTIVAAIAAHINVERSK